MLLEAFVEQPRFRGTCYRTANWQWLGETTEHGAGPPPAEPPALDTMVRTIAELGGFLNRRRDGFPDPQTLPAQKM